MSIVGIIAGKGDLPVVLSEEMVKEGKTPLVISLDKDNCSAFRESAGDSVFSINVTQVGKIIKCLKKNNVKEIIFAGKVEKSLVFQKIAFDLTAIKLIAQLQNRNDDTIMLKIIDFLEKENDFKVLKQTDFLQPYILKSGIFCGKELNQSEREDVAYGFEKAKGIAGLDIGQTVIVKNKAVIAVEAIDGTDKTIQRAASLIDKGCIVVKVSKVGQDLRFDVPTIGSNTLENMKLGKMKVIAFEAGKTFCPRPEKLRTFAKKNNITIVGI
ncbi:MAG: UDP-2,3-diacylglucosamine diphosphatase LpxI [Nitrospinae bacterium]|nr:UDP-2,3-diacylglucosamine diphosphatase LpxI [Nitrospinota bacterium]